MWFVLIALSLGGGVPSQEASPQPLDELAERIQSHLDHVQNFEAQFTQRYTRRILGKVIEERGVVTIKKPGRMRWDYLTPEEKLFITDGTKTYFYLPEERQVMVSHAPTGALAMGADSPFSLLAGRSRLLEAFTIGAAQFEPQRGGQMIRLTPRHPREEFEAIELEAASADGQVLRVVVQDSLGNLTEFLFEEIEENLEIPDSLFLFTIPSGVDVVVDSGSSTRR